MTSQKAVKLRIRKRRSARLREEIHETVLRCGMPALILPKKGFQRKVAIAATRYGSIDLVFRTAGGKGILETPPGIAHFLEHQLFKKEGGQDILSEFGRYGASSNAFTDYNSTTYYFTTSGGFDPSLDLLLSLTFSPFFDPEYVAKEKLIIEQELRMYEDMPDFRAYRALMEALYQKHPVRIDIGGSVEDIQKISPELLERCYRVFYHPTNMIFVASGDIDPREVLERVDRALPPERFQGDRVIERILPEEPVGVKKERVENRFTVSRPRVLLGIKDMENGPLLARDLATSVCLDLVFGPSGDFYNRAYPSGLIDGSFSSSYTAEPEFAFTVIGGETDEPEKLERDVRSELKKALDRRFKKRDVERSKRKLAGRILRSWDSPDRAAFLTQGCVMKGVDPFEIPDAIQKITPQSLDRRLRAHFQSGEFAVSVVYPK